MDRRHLLLLGAALVALVLVHLVFRVRVVVASARQLLMVVVIVAVVALLWPTPRDR